MKQQLKDNTAKIENLEKTIEIKDQKIDNLEKSLGKAQRDIFYLSTNSCDVGISGDGYCILKTNIGHLTVSCKGVIPYLDGSKAKIQLGNVLSAGLLGAVIDVEYGEASEGKDFIDWVSSLKKAEIKLTDEVLPGSWYDTEVVLRGVPPEKLGYVSVSVKIPSISLKTKTSRQQ